MKRPRHGRPVFGNKKDEILYDKICAGEDRFRRGEISAVGNFLLTVAAAFDRYRDEMSPEDIEKALSMVGEGVAKAQK